MTRMLFFHLIMYTISWPVQAIFVPCPSWDEGFYVNRKCFKVVDSYPGKWFLAQEICLEQDPEGGVILAEPRTLEETELALNLGEDVWIGAIQQEDEGHRFDTDNVTMEFFDQFIPTHVQKRPSCIRSSGANFIDADCNYSDETLKQVCQKGVSQTYVIPLLVASGAYMDIVAHENTTELQKIVAIYRGLIDGVPTMADYHEIYVSGPSDDVTTFQFPDFPTNETKSIQSSSVEVVTSHPVTLTLWYNTDPITIRFLLHPFFDDIGRIESSPSYTISTPNSFGEYFILSVVSMDTRPNDIEVIFVADHYSGDYVWVDSLYLLNPKGILATLSLYQSMNINGTLTLDGSKVKAAQEVAVYVIIFGAASNDSHHNVSSVHQSLPSKLAFVRYITFPSNVENGAGYDAYKVIPTRKKTTINVDGQNHFLLKISTTLIFHLPNNHSFLVSGDQPFLINRVFETGYDTCTTPLISSEMWKDQYTTPTQWLGHLTSVTLHIIIGRNWTESVYLNDLNIQLGCSNVTGSGQYVACFYDLPSTFWSTPSIIIRAPEPFGVYSVWDSSGVTGCQTLGIDWFGDWKAGGSSGIITIETTTTTSGTTTSLNSTPAPATTPPPTTTPPLTTTSALFSTTSMSYPSTPYGIEDVTSPGVTSKSNPNLTCSVSGLIKRTNLTSEELDEVVQRIQRILQIDVTLTSSFIRSKTSAKDYRPSSTGIGYSGVAFIVIILAMVIITDILTYLCKASPPKAYDMNELVKN